ncbi:MAG: TolB-like 6-bladed beta-propeller domain-containing protein, partial [Bacteroidales bacterium]|nr:TolB-like 6-bladed beta-propeller domain-containing protein [Bacteroidales bacterium]
MKKIYCLVLIFCVSACDSTLTYQQARTFSQQDLGQEILLKGRNVEFDQMIMRPKCMVLIDSVLILTNLGTEFLLHRFNLRNGKKMGESIPFGSGPEEMLGMEKPQIIGEYVWITDLTKLKAYQYDKQDFCLSDKPTLTKSIQFTDYFDKLMVLSNHEIVASGLNTARSHLSFY